MSKNKTEKNFYVPDEHEKKIMGMFKRITAIPYVLIFLCLLMPFATVSCTGTNVVPQNNVSQEAAPAPHVEMKTSVLMEASFYQLISGVNLEEQMTPESLEQLKKMEKSSVITSLKQKVPEYPKMPGIIAFAVVLLGVLLCAVFAQFTPLGSITLSMLTWISMWGALSAIGRTVEELFGVPVIKVEPGIGLYAATVMIFFGVAMNFTTIIRPIIMELKARRKAKKAKA